MKGERVCVYSTTPVAAAVAGKAKCTLCDDIVRTTHVTKGSGNHPESVSGLVVLGPERPIRFTQQILICTTHTHYIKAYHTHVDELVALRLGCA